jgi:putative nucleotidyltransferase with HDIG domain
MEGWLSFWRGNTGRRVRMFDPRQKRLLLKVKEYYTGNRPDYAHEFDHTARVVYWAKALCEKERADCGIVIPAAILHDIGIPKAGDEGHARKGAEMCAEFLNEYDEGEIERIAEAIRQHSTDDPVDEGETRSVEGEHPVRRGQAGLSGSSVLLQVDV